MTDVLTFQALVLDTFRDLNASGCIYWRTTATDSGALRYRITLRGTAIGEELQVDRDSAMMALADARQRAKKARQRVRDARQAD